MEGKSSTHSIPACHKKPKKKKNNSVSVCLTNCHYDLVSTTAEIFGYPKVEEDDDWNLYWTDMFVVFDKYKKMKRYQKINHFPGMSELCRKDLLARNLNRMSKLFPKDYKFFPKTWCLPFDYSDAILYSTNHKNCSFILKPDRGSRGKGIEIIRSLKNISPIVRKICQVYVNRPYLVNGYKFDLRVYVLVTSCDPLRIYIYNEGLVRFASNVYKTPKGRNVKNTFMHLTNYSVNKYSETNGQIKQTLAWLNDLLTAQNHNVDALWNKIDDAIIKTIISVQPVLKHLYITCFPDHDLFPACSELLGIDIILDHKLKPQILEVNHSPSFNIETLADFDVKENLIYDMFAMMNLDCCDKMKIILQDRKRITDRLTSGKSFKHRRKITGKTFQEYFDMEYKWRGDFRLIYPLPENQKLYQKFFNQSQNGTSAKLTNKHLHKKRNKSKFDKE
ncbi:tubulin polyglutamylase TTLL6-like [Aethina tumida]|uniref:tubulin polyglutamylase TTLL6-like n=1 Tax=Aethina tumida TaxID=116153 RepID=UPI00096B4CD5|nr:tubulin polyglutamylase TTLL6-like [Aethina tumida]